MRLVVQRVAKASVAVEGNLISQIERGLLVLVGVAMGDTHADAQYCADKIVGMRIFEDPQGLMNQTVQEQAGQVLLVSQFTLLGDIRKGRRPSFSSAELPLQAEPLYTMVCDMVSAQNVPVQRGIFGADMQVSLVNDGPVTILLDSRRLF